MNILTKKIAQKFAPKFALIALVLISAPSTFAYTVDCPTVPKSCNMTGFTIEAQERAPATPTGKLNRDETWLLYGIEQGTGSAMPLNWALIDSATPEENRWLYSFKASEDTQFSVEVDFDRNVVKAFCDGQEQVLSSCKIDRRAGVNY